MKKLLIIVVLVQVTFGLTHGQEGVRWFSIAEAVQLAAVEPRIIVIDVYTEWCGWCKRMDATTFSDPEVVRLLNEEFYPVKLNAEGKEDILIGDRTYRFVDNGGRGYHEIAAIVTKGRLAYPTVSYLEANGRVIDARAGYAAPERFRIQLDYFGQGAYKTSTFEQFEASFSPPKELTGPPL
jgi:thioredoxin-related protein